MPISIPIQKTRIVPSLLSADFSNLAKEIHSVISAGVDWIHIDVMDNHYVPNLTFGPIVCNSIRQHISVPMDVHLMIEPVDSMIPQFAKAGANIITFHPEASKHPDRTISLIKEYGCQPGIALNPGTPLEYLDYLIDKIDLILLMSVNPGFGGQVFINSTYQKIRQVKKKIDDFYHQIGHRILLQVDGGIKLDNIAAIRAAGADTFVIGSAIFSKLDYEKEILCFRKAIG